MDKLAGKRKALWTIWVNIASLGMLLSLLACGSAANPAPTEDPEEARPPATSANRMDPPQSPSPIPPTLGPTPAVAIQPSATPTPGVARTPAVAVTPDASPISVEVTSLKTPLSWKPTKEAVAAYQQRQRELFEQWGRGNVDYLDGFTIEAIERREQSHSFFKHVSQQAISGQGGFADFTALQLELQGMFNNQPIGLIGVVSSLPAALSYGDIISPYSGRDPGDFWWTVRDAEALRALQLWLFNHPWVTRMAILPGGLSQNDPWRKVAESTYAIGMSQQDGPDEIQNSGLTLELIDEATHRIVVPIWLYPDRGEPLVGQMEAVLEFGQFGEQGFPGPQWFVKQMRLEIPPLPEPKDYEQRQEDKHAHYAPELVDGQGGRYHGKVHYLVGFTPGAVESREKEHPFVPKAFNLPCDQNNTQLRALARVTRGIVMELSQDQKRIRYEPLEFWMRVRDAESLRKLQTWVQENPEVVRLEPPAEFPYPQSMEYLQGIDDSSCSANLPVRAISASGESRMIQAKALLEYGVFDEVENRPFWTVVTLDLIEP